MGVPLSEINFVLERFMVRFGAVSDTAPLLFSPFLLRVV
jgi:hypothetical protein